MKANDELDDMTNSWQFPHKLITNDGFRYANIKKTVRSQWMRMNMRNL